MIKIYKIVIAIIVSSFISLTHADDISDKLDALMKSQLPSMEKRAEEGDISSQYMVGITYLNGSYGYTQDLAKAKNLLEKVAQTDTLDAVRAQYELGNMYHEGKGVAQDYIMAQKFLEKSSIGYKGIGLGSAQLLLATMYHKGQGIPQDLKLAKKWYKEACDDGLRPGCEQYAELNK